ncbi:MAG: hypothetical protein EYC70_15380 [Planctomycetota bacterium]|nr:MAG: hypothetical protein EYC70_15380 [Planctomycetota bacterium]
MALTFESLLRVLLASATACLAACASTDQAYSGVPGDEPAMADEEEFPAHEYSEEPDSGWLQEDAQAAEMPVATPGAGGTPVSAARMPRQAGVMVFLWHQRGRMHEPNSLTPKSGLYDSSDPEIQREHVRLWKEARIQFVAGSWWGVANKGFNRSIDEAFQGYLRRCEEDGTLRMCVYLEEIPGGLEPNMKRVREYARSPGYYRLFDKPVLFLYDRVKEKLTQSQMLSLAKEFFLVITGPPVEKLPRGTGFGCHWFKIPYIKEDFIRQRYQAVAQREDLVLFPLIYHGFDNTATRKAGTGGGGKKWPAQGSSIEWFQRQLRIALEARTRVLMFPWNELGERSAFEPTEEFGSKYYDAMKDAVAQFLAEG